MKRIAVFLVLCQSLACYAQQIDAVRLDSLFNALDARNLAQGSICITIGGKVQYKRAVGNAWMEPDGNIRATVDTRYRIGSVSKLFTSVMIFQLIEQGKLRTDQKLSQYYPDLPNADRITIGNLLNHRSGLHDYTVDTGFPEWMDKPKTHEELLKIIRDKGPDFEPGAKAFYCNTNYLLLSYILEKIDNASYETCLNKRIISKIGLKNTYYGRGMDKAKGESASYKFAEGSWKPERQTDLSIHAGAGSIVSTPTDLTQFIEALFSGKLVGKKSLDQMKTLTDGYGMGMFPFDHGNHPAFGHNGRVEEFYSAVRYFPEDKLAFSYITNGIEYPRTDLLEAALRIIFKEPVSLPFSKNLVQNKADLIRYPGKYTSEQMGITIDCHVEGDQVSLETRGKVFHVEPINENYYMHAPTGNFFEFLPDKGELLIKETDQVYYLKKGK